MRMLVVSLALALWPPALWPLAASAEDVRIRSGEHAGFSRLVLEFSERPRWSLHLGPRSAEVRLGPGDRSLDARDVFTRIPRTRIRSVSATAEGLELELGCDCAVTAFEVRGAALAIDVSDAPASREDLRNVISTAAAESGESGPDAQPDMVEAPLKIVPPDFSEETAAASGEASAPVRLSPVAPPTPPDQDAGLERPPRDGGRGLVYSEVTKAIARATTQGDLRLAPAPPDAETVRSEALRTGPAGANLRLRLPGEEARLPETPGSGNACRDPASFDVSSWVPVDRAPAEAIATLQASLAPDLDKIDEERALDLARLYVGLGFGAEARAVLAALAPRHPEAELLGEMARIVDGEPVQTDILSKEAGCPGRAQLWVALATGEAAEARDVIVAIGELPVALRRQLAPRVMSRLAAEGDAFAAEAVRGTIERAEGPHGASFALAAARMEAQRGSQPGLATIRELASGRAPSADEALALLLELARDRGQHVDGTNLARAETRAQDLRGTGLGTRLEIGLVHAYLQADDFARAGAWFRRILASDSIPRDEQTALARDFFIALGARSTDEALVAHAAGLAGPAADLVRQGRATEAMAERLLDLALPGLAQRYLPEAPIDPPARRLVARARLAAGDGEGALAIIAGLDPRDEDNAFLRAEARRRLQSRENHRGPGGAAPDSRPARDTAAVSGNGARALVEASEAARRQVDALLAAAPQP